MSIAQKKARVDWSKEMLQKYDRGALEDIYNIVTGDEWWIYVYEPESKHQYGCFEMSQIQQICSRT